MPLTVNYTIQAKIAFSTIWHNSIITDSPIKFSTEPLNCSTAILVKKLDEIRKALVILAIDILAKCNSIT